MVVDPFYRLTPLELVTGWVTGIDGEPNAGTTPVARNSPADPRAVLELILAELLQNEPCFLAFSGGRDSSALLALAIRVADRQGLAHPIPYTRVYLGDAESDETEWQELVVRHLGIAEWIRLELEADDDLISPEARIGLQREGVLMPIGIHTKSRVLNLVRGGFVITGEGGDEVFGDLRITALTRLGHGQLGSMSLRHASRKAVACMLPGLSLRNRLWDRRWRLRINRPWLREETYEAFIASLARDSSQEPLRWDHHVRHIVRARGPRLAYRNFEVMARREADVSYRHPFLNARFVDEWSRFGGITGFANRTCAMKELFGDLLPAVVLERVTKGDYGSSVFNRYSRDFVDGWQGTGIREDLVDPGLLRDNWRSGAPDPSTFLMLQQAWLASS